jgi:hypothetical protein
MQFLGRIISHPIVVKSYSTEIYYDMIEELDNFNLDDRLTIAF